MTAVTSTGQHVGRIVAERLDRVVALDPAVTEALLVALFARGHVLVEGVPGTGKTLLARCLARLLGIEFRRVQFTNDLMPSDIVGTPVWRPQREEFEFVRGPLFSNLVLADEINRTSPRTLSCLLEAMERGVVSVEGHEMQLADPFLVLATRNPIEFHGTFPVPEAALDRFLVRVELDYPDEDRELDLYMGRDTELRLAELEPVLDRETLLARMAEVDHVNVSEAVARYAQRVVHATRAHDAVQLGASPRAAIAWLRAARARALLHERDHVLPDDLKSLAVTVLGHRIFLVGGGDARPMLEAVLANTPVEL